LMICSLFMPTLYVKQDEHQSPLTIEGLKLSH